MASMRAMMQSVSLQEQYDENAKWLISQKPFLANILVRTVKEFEGLDPKGVEKLIDGNLLCCERNIISVGQRI